MANILGFQLGSFPINYLGASIGTNPKRKLFWKPLIEKVDRKLAGWKSSSLNQARRKVVVKACLNSLPVYWFHLYKIPSGILSTLDRKRRKFFWGELPEVNNPPQRKIHLVNWREICKPKHKGGLGLDNLSSRNLALLSKWWWKWAADRKKLWWKVIQQKYSLLCWKGLK